MLDFVVGLAVGGVATWAWMKYSSPTVLRDRFTGEVTHILHEGKTFVEAVAQRLGL